MPRLSQTLRFLQSPSFLQAQSALIGQLAECIVIGRTPQAAIKMADVMWPCLSLSLSLSLSHTHNAQNSAFEQSIANT